MGEFFTLWIDCERGENFSSTNISTLFVINIQAPSSHPLTHSFLKEMALYCRSVNNNIMHSFPWSTLNYGLTMFSCGSGIGSLYSHYILIRTTVAYVHVQAYQYPIPSATHLLTCARTNNDSCIIIHACTDSRQHKARIHTALHTY